MSPPRDISRRPGEFPAPTSGVARPRESALARAAAGTPEDNNRRLRERYQKALEMVWRKPDNCPVCDSTAWSIADVVEVAVRLPSTSLGFGDPRQAYVYIPVTCTYCGHTLFFHSGVLDVRLTEEVKAVPPFRFTKDDSE
jgi:hypothetical protein